MKYRIGQSTDIHQLVEGRKLIIGGVEIESEVGLLGHSDADVLLHAIAESIIGALALGDLGKLFPDNDPRYLNADSVDILKDVVKFMKYHNFEINNLDCLILIEQPKIAPYVEPMRTNISKVLECDISQVNVKATTSEKLGYIGRKEGAMAQAVVMLKSKENE